MKESQKFKEKRLTAPKILPNISRMKRGPQAKAVLAFGS